MLEDPKPVPDCEHCEYRARALSAQSGSPDLDHAAFGPTRISSGACSTAQESFVIDGSPTVTGRTEVLNERMRFRLEMEESFPKDRLLPTGGRVLMMYKYADYLSSWAQSDVFPGWEGVLSDRVAEKDRAGFVRLIAEDIQRSCNGLRARIDGGAAT